MRHVRRVGHPAYPRALVAALPAFEPLEVLGLHRVHVRTVEIWRLGVKSALALKLAKVSGQGEQVDAGGTIHLRDSSSRCRLQCAATPRHGQMAGGSFEKSRFRADGSARPPRRR
jgi:hypothetical protein